MERLAPNDSTSSPNGDGSVGTQLPLETESPPKPHPGTEWKLVEPQLPHQITFDQFRNILLNLRQEKKVVFDRGDYSKIREAGRIAGPLPPETVATLNQVIETKATQRDNATISAPIKSSADPLTSTLARFGVSVTEEAKNIIYQRKIDTTNKSIVELSQIEPMSANAWQKVPSEYQTEINSFLRNGNRNPDHVSHAEKIFLYRSYRTENNATASVTETSAQKKEAEVETERLQMKFDIVTHRIKTFSSIVSIPVAIASGASIGVSKGLASNRLLGGISGVAITTIGAISLAKTEIITLPDANFYSLGINLLLAAAGSWVTATGILTIYESFNQLRLPRFIKPPDEK